VKKLVRSATGINIVIIIIAIALGYTFRRDVFYFFTSQTDIIELASQIVVIYMYILPLDSMQCIYGSYIRSIGKEKITTICFMICFYGIGLPSAYILGNVLDWKVKGLWIGIGFGIACMICCICVILANTNLEEQAEKIEIRMHLHKASVVMPSEETIDNPIMIEAT